MKMYSKSITTITVAIKYFFLFISFGSIEHIAPFFFNLKNIAKRINNNPAPRKNGLYFVKLSAKNNVPKPKKKIAKGVMQQREAINAPPAPKLSPFLISDDFI